MEKNKVGRPLKFQSVEELDARIQEYFDYCDDFEIQGKKYPKPYTMSGLAVYLDCNRSTLLNYGKDEQFFASISRARAKCENYAEEQLYVGNDRGAKFALINNYEGWADKKEFSLSGSVETMSEEEIDKKLAALEEISETK